MDVPVRFQSPTGASRSPTEEKTLCFTASEATAPFFAKVETARCPNSGENSLVMGFYTMIYDPNLIQNSDPGMFHSSRTGKSPLSSKAVAIAVAIDLSDKSGGKRSPEILSSHS